MRSVGGLARFVLRAALRGLRTSGLSAALSVLSMSLALLIAGAFGMGIANMRGLLERVGDELTLSAYLAPEVDDAQRAALVAAAARIEGVGGVEAISAQEAVVRFPERTGVPADWMKLLDESPLPASLEVRLRAESRSSAAVGRVRLALAALPGVSDVSTGEDWVAGYQRALDFVRAVALGVGSVLALATLVIIARTIRLGLQERRDELEILALVGASRSTIRLPFLLEGLTLGACAGLLAVLILRGLFEVARPAVDAALGFLAGPGMVGFLTPLQMLALVGSGALLGLHGAALSLAADEHA